MGGSEAYHQEILTFTINTEKCAECEFDLESV